MSSEKGTFKRNGGRKEGNMSSWRRILLAALRDQESKVSSLLVKKRSLTSTQPKRLFPGRGRGEGRRSKEIAGKDVRLGGGGPHCIPQPRKRWAQQEGKKGGLLLRRERKEGRAQQNRPGGKGRNAKKKHHSSFTKDYISGSAKREGKEGATSYRKK